MGVVYTSPARPGAQAASNGRGIDAFRLAAALLVVAIHTSPLLSVDATADFLLTRVLARLAVPFFFMTSGFFMAGGHKPAAGIAPPRPPLRFFCKNLLLYGVCILLYLPLNVYMGYFGAENPPVAMLRDLFFDGTFYHLWYFPAALLGCWVAWALYRLLPRGAGLALAALLYAVGLGGDSYYGLVGSLPGVSVFYDVLFGISSYTRNGMFFAPLFLLLGMWAAHRPGVPAKDGAAPARTKVFCAVGLAAALALMTTEALLLRNAESQRHDSMYLLLPLCAWFLFELLRTAKGAPLPRLRRISMLLFILHPWCIVLVRGAAKALKLTWLLVEVSPVFYLCVCAASLLLSAACVLVWAQLKPPCATFR